MTTNSAYRQALEHAFRHALDHFSRAEDEPVGATVSLDELHARLGRPLADNGTDPAEVIDELVRDACSTGASRAICLRISCWRTRVCRLPGTSNEGCSASLDRLSQDQLRSARAAATFADITDIAVLEFGPAETLSRVGRHVAGLSPSPPTAPLPWSAHSREKPGFSTSAD